MAGGVGGYLSDMAQSPRELDDDELAARLREDANRVRAGKRVEEEAPVDLTDPPVDLDQDGVSNT